MAEPSATTPTRGFLLECSGACGDLGTFIPHVIGAITIAGLAPTGVLFGFAVFLIATDLFYGLPLPVQPMKAISAVILTGGLRPGEVAAGVMIGVVLLGLGITGWIGRLARAIPQSVSAGLQLGLGLLMGVLGLKLILETPWLGFGSLVLLFALTRAPHCPVAPIALAAAIVARWATGKVGIASGVAITPGMPQLVVPSWPEVWRSFEVAVLPQLSLTLTNAVIVTASLRARCFRQLGRSPVSVGWRCPRALRMCCCVPSAQCRCATAPEGWWRNFALVRQLALRQSFSGPCCSSSRTTPPRCWS